MRYFLIIMLLLPGVCRADFGESAYCLMGTVFLPDHTPLRNKTVTITGSKFGPKNVETDNYGKFKIKISYVIPCMSGFAPKSMAYFNACNADSLTISYQSFVTKCSNQWLKFFMDTIHRYDNTDYTEYKEDQFPQQRTVHYDIVLSQNRTFSKDDRWELASFIRQLCKIDLDSLQNSDRYKYYRPTQESYHIPVFIDSYQPLNKNINEFKSLSIWCPSLFTWKYNERTGEYTLTTLMAPGYTKVLRTNAAEKIIESRDEWAGDTPHQSY